MFYMIWALHFVVMSGLMYPAKLSLTLLPSLSKKFLTYQQMILEKNDSPWKIIPPVKHWQVNPSSSVCTLIPKFFSYLGSRKINSFKNSSPDHHTGMAEGCENCPSCAGTVNHRSWQRRCEVSRRSDEYCQNHFEFENFSPSERSFCKTCCWCCYETKGQLSSQNDWVKLLKLITQSKNLIIKTHFVFSI